MGTELAAVKKPNLGAALSDGTNDNILTISDDKTLEEELAKPQSMEKVAECVEKHTVKILPTRPAPPPQGQHHKPPV